MRACLAALLLLPTLFACGDRAEEGEPAPALFTPTASEAPRCDPAADHPRIDAEIPVRVLRGAGVSEGELRGRTRALAGYFAPSGLRFVAVEVGRVELEELSSVTRLPDGATDEAAASRVGAPIGEFLREHARGGTLTLVVLRRIAARHGVLRRALPHLRGLTLTPASRARMPLLGASLPERFAPTIVLSLDDVPRGAVDTALAHEVGHAAGLDHVEDPHALMAIGPHDCLPTLSAVDARAIARLGRAREGASGR